MSILKLERLEAEIQEEVGVKIDVPHETLCHDGPDSIVIGEYTIYKQSNNALLQEDREYEEPEREEEKEVLPGLTGSLNTSLPPQ